MRFSLVLASVAALAFAQIDPITVSTLNAAQVRDVLGSVQEGRELMCMAVFRILPS